MSNQHAKQVNIKRKCRTVHNFSRIWGEIHTKWRQFCAVIIFQINLWNLNVQRLTQLFNTQISMQYLQHSVRQRAVWSDNLEWKLAEIFSPSSRSVQVPKNHRFGPGCQRPSVEQISLHPTKQYQSQITTFIWQMYFKNVQHYHNMGGSVALWLSG